MKDTFENTFASISTGFLQDEDIATFATKNGLATITDHICEVSRGVSLEKKNTSAINHINYALQNHIKIPNVETIEDLELHHYTDDLCGKFGTYFAIHARKRKNPNAPLVSLSTAVNYMSALKTYFIDTNR